MLWQLTALEAAERIRDGRSSSEELVAACLERIRETDGAIGAWAYLDGEQALEQARAMDRLRQRGQPLGDLHGVPVGIKDIFDTHDMPTECGTAIHKGRQPNDDATVVSKLKEAGAVIMGKTVTTEFAFMHPAGTTNPHNADRTPGGSSSGSAAAVAAGHVPLAIGTQTNGSVIRPASFCGVYGFKPTRGIVSRGGALQTSKTLDQVGGFARSLGDVAALADVLKGFDRADPTTHVRPKPQMLDGSRSDPPMEPSFAWFELPFNDRLDDDARDGLMELIEALGARVEVLPAPASFSRVIECHRIVHEYEICRHLSDDLETHWDLVSATVQPVIERARTYSDDQYRDALDMVQAAEDYFSAFFADYDAVLAPSATGEAPPLTSGTGDPIFSTLWTFAGLPCLTLPLLAGAAGLPVGVQMIGCAEQDDRLLTSANWLQLHLDDTPDDDAPEGDAPDEGAD